MILDSNFLAIPQSEYLRVLITKQNKKKYVVFSNFLQPRRFETRLHCGNSFRIQKRNLLENTGFDDEDNLRRSPSPSRCA